MNKTHHRAGALAVPIKRWLREKYGNKCQRCGWGEINPTSSIVPLTAHHIDGNCLNNHHTNLELLCPNCHALTPTYGGLNVGHGRTHKGLRTVVSLRGSSLTGKTSGLHPEDLRVQVSPTP